MPEWNQAPAMAASNGEGGGPAGGGRHSSLSEGSRKFYAAGQTAQRRINSGVSDGFIPQVCRTASAGNRAYRPCEGGDWLPSGPVWSS